jgi:hypothetical protein
VAAGVCLGLFDRPERRAGPASTEQQRHTSVLSHFGDRVESRA